MFWCLYSYGPWEEILKKDRVREREKGGEDEGEWEREIELDCKWVENEPYITGLTSRNYSPYNERSYPAIGVGMLYR